MDDPGRLPFSSVILSLDFFRFLYFLLQFFLSSEISTHFMVELHTCRAPLESMYEALTDRSLF
jgi:hypothetical protein